MMMSAFARSSSNTGTGAGVRPWSVAEYCGLIALTLALAWHWNWRFIQWCSLTRILAMNDTHFILEGYRQTPHLLVDGLRWWHGTWIETTIYAFRPVASYLYWIECDIGLRHGFYWVGCIGFALFVLNCLLSSWLAWRLTRSRCCVVLSICLATALPLFNWAGFTPEYWLAWFPVHQELLMHALLLGALLCFDAWHDGGRRRSLAVTWLLFATGCLTKEHVYIFPLLGLVVVLLRRSSAATVQQRRGLVQVGWMMLFVLLLWIYRTAIIAHPRNPVFRPIMLLRKPFLYLAHPFYLPLMTGQAWQAGLALLLVAAVASLLHCRHSEAGRRWLARPFGWAPPILLSVLVVYVYLTLSYGSATDAVWFFADPMLRMENLIRLVQMVFLLYVVILLVKYRSSEPTAAAVWFLILSYVPVWTYLGWHYTIPGWFMRSAFLPLVVKLVWRDTTQRTVNDEDRTMN